MLQTDSRKNEISKEIYRQVLEELLQHKELVEITTTEIIERSGMSRTTFYKYFNDKYDLAQWEFDYMLQHMLVESYTENDSDRNIRAIVHFVDDRKNIYKKVLRYTGQNSFNENYIRHSIDVARELRRQEGMDLSAREIYVIKYHAAGFLYVINEWVQSDDHMDAEEVVQLINENRSRTLKSLYLEHHSS